MGSLRVDAWDHPREYGENTWKCSGGAFASGPSPRIRGEYMVCVQWQAVMGTIPANTGRIVSVLRTQRRQADHPREYGENIGSIHTTAHVDGPSPRIRGESCVPTLTRYTARTIPANTGRMGLEDLSFYVKWDHPREYGENAWDFLKSKLGTGPSPRIRGEYSKRNQIIGLRGTIPANTGRI